MTLLVGQESPISVEYANIGSVGPVFTPSGRSTRQASDPSHYLGVEP